MSDFTDQEWLEGIRDNHPRSFTLTTIERLKTLAPTHPLAGRLLALREKYIYDNKRNLPTEIGGRYFQPGDLLQAYRLHVQGRWPAERPPGPRHYRSPMLALQAGMRGVAFYDTVTRRDFASALGWLKLRASGHYFALEATRFMTRPDGTPYYDHESPSSLAAALSALGEQLIETLKENNA